MFAPSPKSSAARRNKPYTRKAQAMSRSGSILGTIRNIVAAPLSWWASNEEFEDLGKRRRVDARDASGDESENEGRSRQKAKRIRLDSPERAQQQPAAGYLDPPPSSFRSAQEGTRWNDVGRIKPSGNAYTRRTATYSAMPLSDSRTMSVDPPSQYTKLYRDRPMGSLSLAPPIKTSHSMSLGPHDSSVRPPPSPFKLRTSLTPQPSIAKPIRREASAPPPLSSLQSKPVFVKPPPEETSARQLSAQKTLSLGTLAEFSRAGRSPSQDRMLTSFGSLSSVPSQSSTSISSNATLQTMQSTAEKTFHKLEMYKTPIVPSRYKDAKVIPDFLKPKRVHVPIPMPKKGREVKPSLGMAKNKSKIRDGQGENKEQTRGSGKPYAGKGGLSKLLARRKAEAEEERGRKKFGLVDEEMDEEEEGQGIRIGKRDVGVSARLTSGSEDERAQKRRDANVEANTLQSSDPFAKSPVSLTHGGRSQPYGRVGRTRVRDPGLRSVPLGRTANTNKFSAAFEEEEGAGGEDLAMDTADDAVDNAEKATSSTKEKEAGTVPAFVAPKGFTFASNETAIQHDHAGAKEPPIPSLPFSFGKPPAASTDATPKTAGIPSFFKPPASTSTSAVQSVPATDATKAQASIPVPPKVSVVPPTPNASAPASVRQETTAPLNFFATPPVSSSTTSTAPSSSGIPNFFAQSTAYKGNASVDLPSTVPSTASPFGQSTAAASVPVKDPENPLWGKNGGPVSTPGAPIAAKPAIPKPLFGDAGKPFSFGAKPAENADTKIATPSPLPASLFGTMPKQAEPSAENRPASAPLFGAQAAAASAASSSLLPSVTGISVQPAGSSPFASSAQTTTSKPAEPEGKATGLAPSPFFAFGANGGSTPKPLFGTGSTSSPATPFQAAAQPAQSANTNTQQSSPFTFGAPPIASTSSNTAAASANAAPVAPKPLFGGTTGGTGFTFGAPAVPVSSAPGVDAAKSPFAFGAPPATPPSGAERKETSFPFGTSAPSSSSGTTFTFGTPAKTNENVPAASPFTFGARPAQPATPPSKADEGMNMEESPIRMDMNGGNGQNKPTGGITFGLGPTPVNPFGQPGGGASSMFPFGGPEASPSPAPNPFGAKEENKLAAPSSGGFNFNRTASAPAISTTFSFGQKSEGPTPPTTAFGAPTNPFGQAPPSSGSSGNAAPFSFGQQSAPASNPFGAPSQQQQPSMAVETVGSSAPSSPFTSAPSFSFGASSAGTGNPFSFGSSQPSSPAGAATGLPQSPATGNTGTPSFTFGQPSGASGSTLFNIGAPPPSTAPGGTPGRQMKKLPRRGPAKR
ncbi:hypothetical protein M0805_003905 [Coniferiporia weirii]|nr:hypothetical protein M0805_003905 [Coniferiporia weirii]